MSVKLRGRKRDGIYDRKGDGWLWLQHAGKRVSLKTKDPEQARINAEEHKRRQADPAHGAAHLTTIETACQKFRAYAKTGENRKKPPSAATFEMYETHFAHFGRIFGHETRLSAIDSAAVDDYIATRRGEHIGKAPPSGQPDTRRLVEANTVDKELGTLRQILRLGLRRGWFHLPLERVLPASSGAEYVPLTRYLTPEQVRKLLAEFSSPSSPLQTKGGYRGVYRIAGRQSWEAKISNDVHGKRCQKYLGCFDTPLAAARAYDAAARELHGHKARLNFPDDTDGNGRAAALAYVYAFGADWCAVERATAADLGGPDVCNLLVLIRGTKNAKRWDEVPLIGRLFGEFADAARAYLAAHGSFPKWGKQRMRDMAAACRRAGVPRVTPRDLRRSFGKALQAAGVAPHQIAPMLRHTDGRMAEKVYAVPERADIGRQVAAAVG